MIVFYTGIDNSTYIEKDMHNTTELINIGRQ